MLSTNAIRDRAYKEFIVRCEQGESTVHDIAKLGAKWMKREGLHPHFFANHSFFTNALYLALFSLSLPFDYENIKENSQHYSRLIKGNEATAILKLYERAILERVPIPYLTHQMFYLGHLFYVNEHVLVPRSLMKTQFKEFLNNVSFQNYRILDLCAGSGCIGITLALLDERVKVDLVDISEKALEVATINVNHYSLGDRVKCLHSDLFTNVIGKYDLIITNPPYVSQREYDAQPLEVKHEPAIALKGGMDGLEVVDKILKNAKNYLNPNGLLIAEVGYSAAKLIKKRYRKVPFKWLICRAKEGKESIVDKLIRWSGELDSIFICKENDLPG